MNIKNLLTGKIRKFILLGFDCLCFTVLAFAFFCSSYIFEPSFNYEHLRFLANSGILLLCILVMRYILGIYNSVWRYTRTVVQFKLVMADCIGGALAGFFSWVCGLYIGFWFFIILASLNSLSTLVSRFCYRLLYKLKNTPHDTDGNKIPVAIVGAGQIGSYLANELLYNPNSKYQPMFFIEKDLQKVGNRLVGLKIYPENDDIFEIMEKYKIEEIFIAIGKLEGDTLSQLFEFFSRGEKKLKLYDVPVKDINSTNDTGDGRVIRSFEIEDLLFRKPLEISDSRTTSYYSGKTVLITGGGGSIGSELCRQVAKCSPKKLVILDIYENNAYDIEQELTRTYGTSLDLGVEIASVRDRERLDAVFAYYKPDIVFHAAAHKHVPLMEHSGCEAIKNNIFGTYNAADMAEKHGVEKFILISTDKAVNPTNIMGASKRACEMIVQSRADSKTGFAAVRFGNVLGSNGSVIPLFKQQIAQGGPITITDKRIIRYFMTIPEASQLVMQAGAMAKQGELFVLDMGKPVKIYDLAVNMIKLSGLRPGVDIKIEEIGLRPGEKLYEELLIKTETLDKTENDMIFIEKDRTFSRREIDEKLEILSKAVKDSRNELASPLIKKAIRNVVPTFVEPEQINKVADKSAEMIAAV